MHSSSRAGCKIRNTKLMYGILKKISLYGTPACSISPLFAADEIVVVITHPRARHVPVNVCNRHQAVRQWADRVATGVAETRKGGKETQA